MKENGQRTSKNRAALFLTVKITGRSNVTLSELQKCGFELIRRPRGVRVVSVDSLAAIPAKHIPEVNPNGIFLLKCR